MNSYDRVLDLTLSDINIDLIREIVALKLDVTFGFSNALSAA